MYSSNQAYLTSYSIPDLNFLFEWEDTEINHLWSLLRDKAYRSALLLSKELLAAQTVRSSEEQAALLVARAAAELYTGATDQAKRNAGKSLDLFSSQWMSHRILIAVLIRNQDYKAAFMHLSKRRSRPVALWDEAPTKVEKNTALAGWSWLLADWDLVAKHLSKAYPKGVSTMPEPIQEDWFRLSLYRDRPEDAVAVASVLIEQRPIAVMDELLQTIVQNGWTKQALPLYRSAFASFPESQLLRRRLVALCIREGALEEARKLTKPGALDLAA